MLAYSMVRGQVASAAGLPREVIKYLQDRGISLPLADSLGLKFLPAYDLFTQARGTAPAYPDSRYAIVFPHFSPLGYDIDWWSARLVQISSDSDALADVKALKRLNAKHLTLVHSFNDQTDPSAAPALAGKMFCPPNTPPAAYLPQARGESSELSLPDWTNIPRGSRIYFHESVLKAINGAVLGHYSIGLNGVWGWSSRKHNLALLPEILDIPWKALELQPVILFDTNISTSDQVAAAAKRLAARLLDITGREAKLLRMEQSPEILGGEPFGFDDYVQAVGAVRASQFLDTPLADLEDLEINPVELLRLELNDKVCVVKQLSRVAEISSGTLMTHQHFTNLNYATYLADVPAGDDGSVKAVNVPKLWLQDARRTEVESLVYEPGHPRLVDLPVTHGSVIMARYLNVWKGWGIYPADQVHTPETGLSVESWLQLLTANVDIEDLREWILDWLAYPLQNPGSKMNSLLLLFGPSGTGKDMLLKPLHTIYGANAVKIGNDEIKSTFTSLYAQSQFIHLDELQRAKTSGDSVNQKIKGLVTNPKQTVNRKGEPEYKVRNVSNLTITSNYYDCVKLDEDDRRTCIVRWSPVSQALDQRGNQDYWRPLADWLESAEGAAQVFRYLLDRDLSRFDPAAWAPSTPWKEEVIDAARGPLERFCAQLKTEPDAHLPPLTEGRCLFTAKELALYHLGQEPAKGQIDALSNELRNQSFIRANKGNYIRTKAGVLKFWVIMRGDNPTQDWQNPTVCSTHLKAHGI